ncbi:hypothetical protein LO772_22545 [Yinghuangia sp. ASG 101]|uniref:hypothetical protein n=1 Tax=Yinghuangia sp. ASG 101 TaxID=2896848 RepID=UPI001E3F0B2A|nr:hypothetical protein [Yinghuangia sp. ASG 101]UGQ09685.1 hypothetical protein LO772_22545 [Yinghuangia sp. ASG 101]
MTTVTAAPGRAGSIDPALVTRPHTARIGAASPLGRALARVESSAPDGGGFNSYVGAGFNSYVGDGAGFNSYVGGGLPGRDASR